MQNVEYKIIVLLLFLLAGCKNNITEPMPDYFDNISGRYYSEQGIILLLEHNGKQINGTAHMDGKNFSVSGHYDKIYKQVFIAGRCYYPQYGEMEVSFILFANEQKELRGNFLMQNQFWNTGSQLVYFKFAHELKKAGLL